jgi:hypothetical protein
MFTETLTSETKIDILSIEHKKITPQSFMELKPVSIQRNEKERFNKTLRVLAEKTLPTHLEVAAVIANFEDEYYEYGKLYSINGNTRKYVWQNFPDVCPKRDLYLTIYQANTRKEIDEIYRSIDSQDSVETAKHMIGGIFRDTNKYPESKYIASGKFTTALRHAYSCFIGDKKSIFYQATSFLEIKNKKEFEMYKNEIFFLDKFYLDFEGDKTKTIKYNFGSVFAALLLISKKYGIDNPKVTELVTNLTTGKTIIHEGPSGLNDGLSVINQDLYDYYHLVLQRWSDMSAGHGPVIIGQLLFCMDAYMNDTMLKIKKSNSRLGIVMKDEDAKEFFFTYFHK